MTNSKTIAFLDDKLNRKVVAENFKNILLNTDLNVFSLVAPWGGGKTYFIQNLIRIMEEDSINILYNAWESDFYDSPLIPLLVELLNKLEHSYEMTELEEDIKSVKEIVKKICSKTSFQAGFNFKVVNCSVNFDPGKKMLESEYLELKDSIKEFRSKLKSIQEKLKKKIIIFIDELDRCHPIYTIKTLEVIKHFFGIKDIVFVLAVDKLQIENSVRTIYGINEGQENGYLRKFIDVEFQLPEPYTEALILFHLQKIWDKIDFFVENNRYYNYRLQRRIDSFGFARNMDVTKEQEYLSYLINLAISVFEFSIRDIEKMFVRLGILLDSLKATDVLLIEPCIIFTILSLQSPQEYDDYINRAKTHNAVQLNESVLPYWTGFFKDSYKRFIENSIGKSPIGSETPESNAVELRQFFQNTITCEVNQQIAYLQSYPEKIKFINSFKQLNIE